MSIELIWTLICVTGMAVSAWGFHDSGKSIRVARQLLADARSIRVPGITTAIVDALDLLIFAKAYRRNETLRFLAHAVLFVMGIAPTLDPDPVRFSLFVAGLIAVNLFILANSLGDATDRWRIRRRKEGAT